MRRVTPQAEDEDTGEPPILSTAGGEGASSGGGLLGKAVGVRPWLRLDSTGQPQVLEAGKHAVMTRTGLSARDLRILDPLLSYPSTVVGRERAIVVNLEQIKAIVTAQEVLLLYSGEPSLVPFVDDLQRRILLHSQAINSQEAGEDADWTDLYDIEEPQSTPVSPNYSENIPSMEEAGEAEGKEQFEENRGGLKLLPFEFVTLEACLEAACTCLDNEARTLEQEAHPALTKLTSKISTLNLERLRQIKSRLVAITGRVQKVRDELERLLGDDVDMADMCLTDKLQERIEYSVSSMYEQDGSGDKDVRAIMDDRSPAEILREGDEGSTVSDDADIQRIDSRLRQLFGGPTAPSRGSHETHTSTHSSAISKDHGVVVLEMLLEAYFVQIDGTLNKLSALREYVDDTEDYINTMLDDKQNRLLQMGVTITTATLLVNAFLVVTGIFAMNINIEIFNDQARGTERFLWTAGGGTTGVVFLYVIAIAWFKHRRLLE